MEMEVDREAVPRQQRLRFTYRGKEFVLAITASSTLRELGQELQSATGISPQTMKLLVPRGARGALEPFSEECAMLSLGECGIEEGKVLRVMGALPHETVEVSGALQKDTRSLGFEEEEERARRRASSASATGKLPAGPYTFQDFKTLQLPGVQMTPPPPKALELLHALASDRGIIAIMNKYRWRVGVLSEMAPEGLVGISPKCLLGFNKNRGEEISLRLRTDDLKGFRKYESIRKTLLHELAHMVHDEHDENFHQLDKLLNKESLELDWTRSRGQSLSGMKHQVPDSIEDDSEVLRKGHRLGGGSSSVLNVKVAAANAALNRLKENAESSKPDDKKDGEPDPDETQAYESEPDPDELHAYRPETWEPDPDEKESHREPDPDENKHHGEPDPDEKETLKDYREPDPDENEHHGEPDPDEKETLKDYREPDPDENEHHGEPDPDEKETLKDYREPDPDDNDPGDNKRTKLPEDPKEPDPDDGLRHGSPFQKDVEVMEMGELDMEIKRINAAAAAASSRLEDSIAMLTRQATPLEAAMAFQTLVKILSNVMEHPNEEKFRRIKKNNPVFQERVAKFAGAIELLKMVGFAEEAAMSSFVLKTNDPGLLWLARSLVTSALGSYVHG
ncbi:uncharacterized protein LOC112345127 isoform X2 [Selaginella moellendorffii]|uniref:uncharacterized protein LOC112345127 isoform X2 n=1 Tax=Selaginella moellendorffii TaxID=88036 RepID=UPI000D1C87E0|nr:uncharacterized protein LOC112345127 isoform X2 [Selaginella moellendorffii]|eukprot:XP_024527001.1 uncharacterized protein LOC112345127 isoform X2 [Selaginella moellendorffii]